MRDWIDKTHIGDCRKLMWQMIADGVKVQSIITSPPYWQLRSYDVDGQYGLERTWVRHVARMRNVFRVARELLADDGTLWLNYGDSYAGTSGGTQGVTGQRATRRFSAKRKRPTYGGGLKPKDLVGMPWRIAFALQDDGWWLRSDIVWVKQSPMPESMKDRPTKSHEFIFLMAKQKCYYYNAEAIAEPTTGRAHPRGSGVNPKSVAGWAKGDTPHGPKDHARAKQGLRDSTKFGRGAGWRNKQNDSFSAAVTDLVDTRNVRDVWTIPAEPFPDAHFATFPTDLVKRCILAGTQPGDIVLDMFHGSGTVGQCATDLARRFIGIELKAEYIAMHYLRRTTTGFPF